jgi:hypothetical protein
MAKVDCSELSKLITEMAMIHSSDPNIKNLDDVLSRIQKDFPLLKREDLVDAIVETTTGQSAKSDELTKKLMAIRQEARTEKGLKQKISELEQFLETGEFPKSVRKKKKAPDAIEHLREIRDGLKKQLNRSEGAQAERIKKSIATLEERIASGDILPKTRVKPAETKQLERLDFEKKKLQNQIRNKIQMMKPKSIWEKIAEPWNMFRALMTGGEFSLVLRQGGWTAVSRPGVAIKSIPGMFKAFGNEQAADKINTDLNNRPNAPLYAKAGIHISPVDGSAKLTKLEEVYMSHWIENIPIIRNFQRAGITFLNLLRANSFDVLNRTLPVDKNGIANIDELKAIGNYINVNTGRGNLGALERAAVGLNTVFFAPRYVVSRFQLLLGQPLWQGTKNTRKIIGGEYARALVGIFAVMLLGKMVGGDIEEDPRSADFGKIRFGKTRVDPLFGLSQTAVVLSRIALGKTKTSKGELKPLRGKDVPFGSSDTFDVGARFLRTKFSPMLSTVVDFLAGENVVGEEVNLKNVGPRLVVPLAYRDIYEAFLDQDVAPAMAMSLLVMFGVGLQTYGKPLDTWTRKELLNGIKANTYRETQFPRSKGIIKGRPHKGKKQLVNAMKEQLKEKSK